MKKINILRKNWQIQEIIDSKKFIISNFLILYWKKRENFKIAIAVSKKFGNAVFRNKHKRQIKSILDKTKPWSKKMWCVLIVRKPFFELDFKSKEEKIQSILDSKFIKEKHG